VLSGICCCETHHLAQLAVGYTVYQSLFTSEAAAVLLAAAYTTAQYQLACNVHSICTTSQGNAAFPALF
jgi:hypothetical protein